jgi:hypothetical protein
MAKTMTAARSITNNFFVVFIVYYPFFALFEHFIRPFNPGRVFFICPLKPEQGLLPVGATSLDRRRA